MLSRKDRFNTTEIDIVWALVSDEINRLVDEFSESTGMYAVANSMERISLNEIARKLTAMQKDAR